MFNLDENYKFTIDEKKLNNLLDNLISNDPSLVVGKLPVNEPVYKTLVPITNNKPDTSILALTVRPVKESFLSAFRVSFKVAVSTFFIHLAKIFI